MLFKFMRMLLCIYLLLYVPRGGRFGSGDHLLRCVIGLNYNYLRKQIEDGKIDDNSVMMM